MIAQFIQEKFEEHSDPIHDMGIGIEHEIISWAKKNYPGRYPNHLTREKFPFDDLVDLCIGYNVRLDIVKYLLKTRKVDIDNDSCYRLRSAVFCNKDDQVKLLLKFGASINKAISIAKQLHEIVTLQKLLELKKGSINEGFTEKNSDPIRDMGIGLDVLKKKYEGHELTKYCDAMDSEDLKNIRKGFKTSAKNLFYLGSASVAISTKKNILEIQKIIKNSKNIFSNTYLCRPNEPYYTTLNVYQTDIGKIGVFSFETNKNKSFCGGYIYFGEIQVLHDLRKRFIFEKFIQDSDPIRDMGIGLGGIKNFKSKEDIALFLIKILPYILHTNEIPNDIIYDNASLMLRKYIPIVDRYIKEHIRLHNKEVGVSDDYEIFIIMHKNFLKRGYKTIKFLK